MENAALAGLNLCFTVAGIAAGTTTTTTITNNTTYCVNGKGFVKTAATNAATPTTDAATGKAFVPVKTSQGSVFVFGLDAAGNIKVCQGEVVALDAGAFVDVPEFPVIPDTITPYGYLLIKAGATASANGWICGASNMASVTGITYTFVDVCALPNRPQIA